MYPVIICENAEESSLQPSSNPEHRGSAMRTQPTNRSSLSVRRMGSLCVLTVLLVVFAVFSWNYHNPGEGTLWGEESTRKGFEHVVGRYLQADTNEHDPLFPLKSRDIWGLVCATMGLILAAGGGIGGGGILVPIYIFVLKFPPKHAIPLSNVTVFGGAVANTLLNSRKRHPLADRPLIDWDLLLAMEPLTIAGALVGTNLNKVLPQTVIVVMLVALLSATAYKTLDKARKMYQKESATQWSKLGTEEEDQDQEVELSNRAPEGIPDKDNETRTHDTMDWSRVDTEEDFDTIELSNLGDPDVAEEAPAHCQLHRSWSSPSKLAFDKPDPLVDQPGMTCLCLRRSRDDTLHNKGQDSPQTDESCAPEEDTVKAELTIDRGDSFAYTNPLLEHILEEERHIPIRNVITITALFLVVLNINIIKGGGAVSSPLGIECGTLWFWLCQSFMLACIVFVSVAARTILVNRTRTKATVEYPYVEGDIVWTTRNTIVYPALSCTAGFVAGLFGIGGGIVKGPLMLQMGVHPAVASATSACMILYTSFTATTSFVVFGLLVIDYAVALLIVGFVATLVGQTVMSMLLRKYQRNSCIAFSIGFVVLLSAILLTLESVTSSQESDTPAESTGGLCSPQFGE